MLNVHDKLRDKNLTNTLEVILPLHVNESQGELAKRDNVPQKEGTISILPGNH